VLIIITYFLIRKNIHNRIKKAKKIQRNLILRKYKILILIKLLKINSSKTQKLKYNQTRSKK